MIYAKIDLKEHYPLKHNVILEIMSPETSDISSNPHPLMVVIGGGGYQYVSLREKDPVCLAYMREGYATASLTYTTASSLKENEKLFPHPYLEMICAMDFLKKNAEKYHFKEDDISMVGFSAGGHLVASFAYLYNYSPFLKEVGVTRTDLKPNAVVLAYPVILMDDNTHQGTRNNITNGLDPQILQLTDIVKHVSKDYPPSFIWNTLEDQAVPEINSRAIAKALTDNGIKNKLIQYPHGFHGLSTIDITNNTKEDVIKYHDYAAWVKESADFIDENRK